MADAYAKYEEIIEACGEERRSGSDNIDFDLLEKLLSRSVADGDTSQSGGLARALDMWIAEQLRAFGFDENAVWPRLHPPRAIDPSILRFIGTLGANLAEGCCNALSRYSSSSADIMGAAYKKQVDVGLSSWTTGPEILISTKTMRSSFGKNLSNRYEEAYGDAKNLKGRHPLATVGFYFLADSKIVDEGSSFRKALSMLQKLQMEEDAYDVVCLHLFDFESEGAKVSAANDLVPELLSPQHFFNRLIGKTLVRASYDDHEKVRLSFSADEGVL